ARPGVESEEVEPWQEAGETWRRLKVRFPADIATHSTEQTLYLDRQGLLRRQDYNVEIDGTPQEPHTTSTITKSFLASSSRRKGESSVRGCGRRLVARPHAMDCGALRFFSAGPRPQPGISGEVRGRIAGTARDRQTRLPRRLGGSGRTGRIR